MSFHIEVTAAQARAIAELAREGEIVWLRQLVAAEAPEGGDDVYATLRGHTSGYRISRDGVVHEVADVLPA